MISTVITTHKRAPDIVLRAINSILTQTYSDYEIIVVDDSPSDFEERVAVGKCLESLNNNCIKYIQHPQPLGACAARNTGLSIAKGEYIAFLDDDDEWLPEKLEKQLSVFLNGPDDLALVYCKFYYYNEDTEECSTPKNHFEYYQRGHIFDSLIKYNYIGSTSFPLIRTDYLREIGGFDEELLSCQDYDVWLRLSEKYSVDYIDDILIRFHIHSNESIGKNPYKRIRGQERLYQKNATYLSTHKDAAWERLAVIAPMYAAANENRLFCKALLKMIGCSPLSITKNTKILLKALVYKIKNKRR